MSKKSKYSTQRPMMTVAFILSAVMMLTSCSEEPLQNITLPQEGDSTLALPYDPAQGTNPYLTNSLVTHQLAGLLYTSLITVDDNLGAQNLLAKMITADEDKLAYSIVLNDGFTFQDASPITATDVAASILTAQGSEHYGAVLQNVSSVTAEGDEVRIVLDEPDGFFYRLLSMPIIKADETILKNPQSSGSYRRDGDSLIDMGEGQGESSDIRLVDLSTATTLSDGINLGRISALDVTYLPGFVPYDKLVQVDYASFNLLYLGFAPSGEFLTPSIRQALSAIIPRDDIVDGSYNGNALASHCLVHPLLKLCECDTPTAEPTFDRVRILYNGNIANRHTVINDIENEFAKHGITLEKISAQDEGHFTELLAQGDYDVYLAETLLPQNLDFSLFIDEEDTSERVYTAYAQMKSGGEVQNFCDEFAYELPIVPILYENGMLFHADSFSGFTPQNSNPYYNISKVVYD